MTNTRKIDFAGAVEDVPDGAEKTEDVHEVTTRTTKRDDIESQASITSRDKEEATLTVITDLSVYEGNTLGERIDSLVATHPVTMFTKTWCLFSIDAQDFLIQQLNVSVHCIELDEHPEGKAIHKYIKEKTKHPTVPVIFIKGEFLGGFEDVNTLYASGKLERDYLKDLTYADRCEEFLKKTKIATKPLFWFPETVNGHVIRISGIITCLLSFVAAVDIFFTGRGRYIAYGICFDFLLRLFGGARLSPIGILSRIVAMPFEQKPRVGRPKQFAAMCGLLFSGLGSLFYGINFPYHEIVGTVFIGGLCIATGTEGFLDFCVGCFIFKYGIKFGIIPK